MRRVRRPFRQGGIKEVKILYSKGFVHWLLISCTSTISSIPSLILTSSILKVRYLARFMKYATVTPRSRTYPFRVLPNLYFNWNNKLKMNSSIKYHLQLYIIVFFMFTALLLNDCCTYVSILLDRISHVVTEFTIIT